LWNSCRQTCGAAIFLLYQVLRHFMHVIKMALYYTSTQTHAHIHTLTHSHIHACMQVTGELIAHFGVAVVVALETLRTPLLP